MRRAVSRAVLASVLALAGIGEPRAGKSSDVRVEAMTLLNEGVTAYTHGDYTLAAEKLRGSADRALNSFRAHFYLGLALTGLRRFPEAVEALDIALDLEPSNMQAHVAMGNAKLKQGDTDEATAAYYRALKLRSEYPAALDGIARVHESRGDDDKAIEFLRRAIGSNKGYAEAYTHLGTIFLRLDRLDEAVRLLREAVSIRADFAYGYNGLAAAYGRLGLKNEAVVTIRKAIDLEPKLPDHWSRLGEIELDMDLPIRAEASFRKALELDPGFPEAREGLAEAARRRGDYAAALTELDAAIADPRLDGRNRERLRTRRQEIESEQVTAAAIEAEIALGTASPDSLRRLASILAGRRLWSEAADLQARSQPEGVERERLAYDLLKAGRHREAQSLYADLARIGERAALRVNEGVAFAGLGDDSAAIEAYRRALAIDPAEDRARLYLANALLRLGRTEEAVAAYRKYALDVDLGPARERVREILAQLDPDTAPGTASPQPPRPPEGKP